MTLMVLQHSHVNKEILMQYTEGHKEVMNKTWKDQKKFPDFQNLQGKVYRYLAILKMKNYIYPREVSNFFSWLQVSGWNGLAAAKSLQSCPTLCDPIDGSPPGSPVPGILQARILGWVAISFSNAGKWKVKVKSLSRVRLFATPWTAAHQAPPSMGFSRQEYWSGVPLPSPWNGLSSH